MGCPPWLVATRASVVRIYMFIGLLARRRMPGPVRRCCLGFFCVCFSFFAHGCLCGFRVHENHSNLWLWRGVRPPPPHAVAVAINVCGMFLNGPRRRARARVRWRRRRRATLECGWQFELCFFFCWRVTRATVGVGPGRAGGRPGVLMMSTVARSSVQRNVSICVYTSVRACARMAPHVENDFRSCARADGSE